MSMAFLSLVSLEGVFDVWKCLRSAARANPLGIPKAPAGASIFNVGEQGEFLSLGKMEDVFEAFWGWYVITVIQVIHLFKKHLCFWLQSNQDVMISNFGNDESHWISMYVMISSCIRRGKKTHFGGLECDHQGTSSWRGRWWHGEVPWQCFIQTSFYSC